MWLDRSRPTGVFFKDPSLDRTISYYGAGSAASAISREDVDRALALHPLVLHMSGITPALSPSCLDAVVYAMDAARAQGVTTSFDVNFRGRLWTDANAARACLRSLADTANIVFVGLDEAAMLWGSVDVHGLRALLPHSDVLVVKDGSRWAATFSGQQEYRVPALPIRVVEAVGAGDAFAAGWLHGYLRGSDHETRLRLGHLLARVALSSVTDYGELDMTMTELEALAESDAAWPPLSIIRQSNSGTGIEFPS